MNLELKQQWIDALTSGEFAQTTGKLHRIKATKPNTAGFCCLGVLCKVMQLPEKTDLGYDVLNGVFEYKNRGLVFGLSDALMQDVGLDENLADELATMNDQGHSFEEIAAVIKERA